MSFNIKNFTIEKFNNDINNSGDLNKKHSDWVDYRNRINEFILKNTGDKKNSIFIFGAGECNDIDLNFLTSEFEYVVLSDIDTESIDEGIKRQLNNKANINKIKKVNAEYTNLSKAGFFENLSDMTSQKMKQKNVSSYIKKTISAINISGILKSEINQHDTVLVLPTYTQLAYTQIETLLRILYQYNIYPIEELNKILTVMHYSMPKIIKNYNQLILSLLKDEGKVIVLSDVFEITDSKKANEIGAKLKDADYIKKLLKNDCTKFGVVGIDDIKAKIKSIDSKYEIWPFDSQKQFLVEFIAGSKK